MFKGKIITGCWEEGTIELKGIPKDFILSARELVVLEEKEHKQLQADLDKAKAENEKLKEQRDSDLYVEFGKGNVSVMTTVDNDIILSKRLGTGVVGEKNPECVPGTSFVCQENDIRLKFKNLDSLKVVKKAVEDIEQALNGQEGS